jgi:hypothetical protein
MHNQQRLIYNACGCECVARSRSQMERMCKKTFRFFNVSLAAARKCIASGENSTVGRNARTPVKQKR